VRACPIRGNLLKTKLRVLGERRGEVSIVSAHNCAHVLLGRSFRPFQVQWSIAGVLITPCLKFNSLTGLKDPMAREQPERVTAKKMDSKRATTAKGNACSSNRATRVEVRMGVKEEDVFCEGWGSLMRNVTPFLWRVPCLGCDKRTSCLHLQTSRHFVRPFSSVCCGLNP
jgi:hypothetical protein